MLGDISAVTELYVVCGYTDMRKSIDGLCTIVRDQLHLEPANTSALYLFCGKRSDRIKALLHEPDGFVLLYKRLDAHTGRYKWPRNKNEVKPITWRQFDWLMSGLEIEQPKAIQRRPPTAPECRKTLILSAFSALIWYNKYIKKEL